MNDLLLVAVLAAAVIVPLGQFASRRPGGPVCPVLDPVGRATAMLRAACSVTASWSAPAAPGS